MALYQNSGVVMKVDDEAFARTYKPGEGALYAGIYRCTKCGHEIGIAEGHILPSQSHGQHPPMLGSIVWQLVVYAQHNQ
ncbi:MULTISPECIES: protein L [Paraburkholderia]|uniref:protein L n=1 Tax=Paraburkholderia TaxID=1822464 RepID=UPI000B3FF412|nr:protein L [Paraburkholderia caledonica]